MRSAGGIVLLAFSVAACNVTDKVFTDATRSGRTLGQLRVDGATCDMALQQSPLAEPAEAGANVGLTMTNIGARMIDQDNFFDACMLSRGWQRKE